MDMIYNSTAIKAPCMKDKSFLSMFRHMTHLHSN